MNNFLLSQQSVFKQLDKASESLSGTTVGSVDEFEFNDITYIIMLGVWVKYEDKHCEMFIYFITL